MTTNFILIRDVAKEWLKDLEIRAEYEALEEEFALAAALIKARAHADMTQEEVAKAMGTTQAVRPAEKWPYQAVHPDAGALCQGDRDEAAG